METVVVMVMEGVVEEVEAEGVEQEVSEVSEVSEE